LSGINPFIRRPLASSPLHPLVKAAVALFCSALFLGLILLTGHPVASVGTPVRSVTIDTQPQHAEVAAKPL
jgi:hypothetical protein